MTARVVLVVVLIALPAFAQDGAWDVPREDELSSPTPVEPVEAEPVVADDEPPADPAVDDVSAEPAAVPAAVDEMAEAAAQAEANALAVAEARRSAKTRIDAILERGQADGWSRSEAEAVAATKVFEIACMAALARVMSSDEPVAASLASGDVRVGVPVTMTLTIKPDPDVLDELAPFLSGERAFVEGPAVQLHPDAEWDAGRFVAVTSKVREDAWTLEVPVQFFREGDVGLDGLVIDAEVAHTLRGTFTLALADAVPVTLDLDPTDVRRVDPERLPPLELPMPPVQRLVVLLVVLAGLTLLGVVAWVLMPSLHAPPAVIIPPERTAIEALADLRARMPQTTDAIPPFIDDVSAVLRTYIEGKFGVAAPDLTTDEFLNLAAARHPALAEREETLRAFLAQCDLVKFANHRPTLEAPPALLATAETFVEDTRMLVQRDDDGNDVAAREAPAEGVAA